ncbi:MAG: low temperature requirement protein A [Candidatus Nanopelagicales bacterium]
MAEHPDSNDPAVTSTRETLGSRGPEQSWLELFYDLAFVAAIVVVTSPFAYSPTLVSAAWLLITFSLIWTTWLMAALYLARVTVDRRGQLLLLASQMGLVLLLAVNADAADDLLVSRSDGPIFALILVSALVLRARAQRDGSWPASGPSHWVRKVLAVVAFVSSAWISGAPYVLLWALGLFLVLSSVEFGSLPTPAQEQHLARRFGEFTIIMLGETFVKIGLTASAEPLDQLDWIGLPLAFALMAMIWWLYFSLDAPAGIPSHSGHRIGWVLGHFPLQLSIAMLAIGMSKILLPGYLTTPARGLAVVVGPLVGVVLSLALLDWLGGTLAGRLRSRILLGAALALVMVGVLSFAFSDVVFDLGLTAVLLVGVLVVTRQVIVDRLASVDGSAELPSARS